MPALAETVARLLRVFRQGSTSPALVETGSGARFVLKFAGAGPGVRALLIEDIATGLAGRLGLPVPALRKLYLPPHFPWQIGTDEFDDLIQRSAGWNLGVAFMEGARDLVAADLDRLPPGFVSRLALADRLLQNVDRTRQNPNVMADAAGGFWAIDHGACLFLDRVLGGRRPFGFELPGNHFLADQVLPAPEDARERLGRIDAARVATMLEGVPDSWLAGIALSRAELSLRLAAYVTAFRAELNRN